MSAETVKLAEELHNKNGLAPAEAFQLARNIAAKEYLLKDDSKNSLRHQSELAEMRAELLRVVQEYGGAVVIDDWLKAHDNHKYLREIKNIDWSFLPENLRPQ